MEALPLLERAAVFRLIESVSASQKYRHEEGSCLTWHWTKDHHIVVLHEVAGETPVDKSAITGSSEGAGIEDVRLVSFREAENSYVKLKVVVISCLEVDGGILIMVNDDVLVGELRVQLSDHSCGEGLLCSMLIIDELVDTLDDFLDELRSDFCDCYEGISYG